MNKQEFFVQLFQEFTEEQVRNINPVIYLNPNHIEYYTNAKMDNYDWCLKYLKNNRELLNVDYDDAVEALRQLQDASN